MASFPPPKSEPKDWRFHAVLVVSIGVFGYAFLWQGLRVFQAVKDYEPLLLPLGVTALSVFPRVTELKTYESILRLSNDVAIGIISFDIWALSASRSNPLGRILISENKMISGDFVIGLLIVGLLVAFGCAVLTNFSHSLGDIRMRQRWLLGALVASILVYVAPFGIIEPVPLEAPLSTRTAEIKAYTVVIPFQDPQLIDIAPAFLKDRWFVQFERGIDGTDPIDARLKGINRFTSSAAGRQINRGKTQPGTGPTVRVQEESVLVVPQQ